MSTHQKEGKQADQKITADPDQRKHRSNHSNKKLAKEVESNHDIQISEHNSDFESNAMNGKKKVGRWTEEEDKKLQSSIQQYGEKSWRIISDLMQGRSAIQCLHRWTKILKPGLRKGPWQEEEDEKLLVWVKNNGPCKWSICAENILGRSGKQCRERWFNNLNPNVKKGGWTQLEDQEIFRGYLQFSSSWSKIARSLTGRTENSVKNRFYSTVRKLLADQEKEGGAPRNPTSGAALKNFIREQLLKSGGMQALSNNFEEEIEEEEVFLEDKKNENENENEKIESQDDEVDDDKCKKKNLQGYPEQNLLYRLLKQQGGPMKRTSCMKDYSTIYKKYKKRYIQKKRDKKLSEKLDMLRHLIMKREDDKDLDFDHRIDKKSMEFNQKHTLKSDLEKQIIRVGSELAQLQSQQNKSSHQSNKQIVDDQSSSLSSGQMAEFQSKLLEFFNQSLSEVMKKFQQDIGTKPNKPVPQWQMILASPDARIVYPPANMPPSVIDHRQFPRQQFQTPNFIPNNTNTINTFNNINHKHNNNVNNNNSLNHNNFENDINNNVHNENNDINVRRGHKKSMRILKKVKIEDSEPVVETISPYASIVSSFFSKFSHLSQIGISQLGYNVIIKQNRQNFSGPDDNFQNQLQADNKIDQKMMFLINQLHTLESMLSNTKKELGRLEASLHEKIIVNNNSFDSASGTSGNYQNKLKREEP